MFRRFTNRLTNALNGSSEEEQEKMNSLQAMGFTVAQARTALMRHNGNLEMAAEYLLSSSSVAYPAAGSASASASASAAPTTTLSSGQYSNQDQALHNALQESLQSEEQRLYKQAQELSLQQKTRSAASSRAGQAAVARFATKPKTSTSASSSFSSLSKHHPDVHVPKKLQDKSKEEQILRCADRLKGHPNAVDTLHKALTTLYNNPNHPKFQQIDTTTAAFQRSLANAPGALSLFEAVNYVRRGQRLVLVQQDPALIYLGKTALEGIQQHSPEYKFKKTKSKFAQELHTIQESVNTSEQEAIRRAAFLQKCPTEPPSGRGALLQVVMGDDTVKRRFDGDDTLRDVVHWMGGHGSEIHDKLVSEQWCLVDRNRYPVAPLSLQHNLDKTLQYIGCWPSGKLELLPMELATNDDDGDDKKKKKKIGSSRGLGAAPSETL